MTRFGHLRLASQMGSAVVTPNALAAEVFGKDYAVPRLFAAPNGDGKPCKRRVIVDLHARIEVVHVYMEYRSVHHNSPNELISELYHPYQEM